MKIYKDNNYKIKYDDMEDVLRLLRGVYHIPISQYDYSEPLPTETAKVMKNYIYSCPDKNIKDIFQRALIILLESSAADAFLAVVYFRDCIYYENNGNSAFNIDMEMLIPLIRQALQKYRQELENGIVFVDGTVHSDPLRIINIWNEKVYKAKYGFSIL